MQYKIKRWRGVSATALLVAGTTLATIGLAFTIASATFAANGIMLQIKEAPLKDVVMMLTQQSGTNIVIADESKLDKKVTASLTDVPLEKALDYVVKSAGVSYKKMDDGTYIIGCSNDEPAVSASDVVKDLPPLNDIEQKPVRETQIVSIKLTHSRPSDLLKLLGWDGTSYISNNELGYPMQNNGSFLVKQAPNTSYGSPYSNAGLVPANTGNTDNVQPVMPLVDPTAYNSGAGRTASENTGSAQYPGGGSYRSGGYGNYQGGYNSGYQGNYGRNSDRQQRQSSNSSSNNSNFLWPDGVDDAKPFDIDNSIIVKGDADGIEKFKKIIRMLDVPPKQVQIKAEFVEVDTTDIKKFGIDWSLDRLNQSFSTSFGPTGNVAFGLTSGNLSAQLKAQLTSTVGRTINSPIISTINNQTAIIQIEKYVPYWTTTTVYTDSNNYTNSTVQWIQVNTQLAVLPRVNGDGTITMTLYPQVSGTGDWVSGPNDSGSVPEEHQQLLTTTRRVADGETIVVGGFINKQESNSSDRIPILGDLPIVGSLFRTTNKTSQDDELLIFVTPTIIPDTTSGSVGDRLIP